MRESLPMLLALAAIAASGADLRPCWRNLTPDARAKLAEYAKQAEGWKAHTERPQMLVRRQFFYGLDRHQHVLSADSDSPRLAFRRTVSVPLAHECRHFDGCPARCGSRQKNVGYMPPPLETGNIGIGNISTFPHWQHSLYPASRDFGVIRHALVRHPPVKRSRMLSSSERMKNER